MSQVNNIDCGVTTCLVRRAHCHYYCYTLLQNAACSVGLPNHIHPLVNDDLIIVTLLQLTLPPCRAVLKPSGNGC